MDLRMPHSRVSFRMTSIYLPKYLMPEALRGLSVDVYEQSTQLTILPCK